MKTKVIIILCMICIFTLVSYIYTYTADDYTKLSIEIEAAPAWIFNYSILDSWTVNSANEIRNDDRVIIGQFEIYRYNYQDTNYIFSNSVNDYYALPDTIYSHKLAAKTITDYIILQDRINFDGREFYRIGCRDESGTYMIIYELYKDTLSYEDAILLAEQLSITYDRTKDFDRPYTDSNGNKVGESIGHIYATDISAYINGIPIRSYSLNGKTAIIVEDLIDYGFNVDWDNGRRVLTVNTTQIDGEIIEIVNDDIQTKPNGTIIGNIYATDIKTYINGKYIESANIGGRTIVVIEDFTTDDENIYRYSNHIRQYDGYSYYGFKTDWNNDSRTISLDCLRPGDYIELDIGSYKIINSYFTPEIYSQNYYNIQTSNNNIIENIPMFQKYENFYILSENRFMPVETLMDILELDYEIHDGILDIKRNSYQGIKFADGVSISNTHTSEGILLELDLQIAVDGIVIVTPETMETAYYYIKDTDTLFINIRAIEKALNTDISYEKLETLPEILSFTRKP